MWQCCFTVNKVVTHRPNLLHKHIVCGFLETEWGQCLFFSFIKRYESQRPYEQCCAAMLWKKRLLRELKVLYYFLPLLFCLLNKHMQVMRCDQPWHHFSQLNPNKLSVFSMSFGKWSLKRLVRNASSACEFQLSHIFHVFKHFSSSQW